MAGRPVPAIDGFERLAAPAEHERESMATDSPRSSTGTFSSLAGSTITTPQHSRVGSPRGSGGRDNFYLNEASSHRRRSSRLTTAIEPKGGVTKGKPPVRNTSVAKVAPRAKAQPVARPGRAGASGNSQGSSGGGGRRATASASGATKDMMRSLRGRSQGSNSTTEPPSSPERVNVYPEQDPRTPLPLDHQDSLQELLAGLDGIVPTAAAPPVPTIVTSTAAATAGEEPTHPTSDQQERQLRAVVNRVIHEYPRYRFSAVAWRNDERGADRQLAQVKVGVEDVALLLMVHPDLMFVFKDVRRKVFICPRCNALFHSGDVRNNNDKLAAHHAKHCRQPLRV